MKQYATAVDRESAREMLAQRMGTTPGAGAKPGAAGAPSAGAAGGEVAAGLAAALNSPLVKIIAGRATTQVMRGLMGALMGPPRRRRS